MPITPTVDTNTLRVNEFVLFNNLSSDFNLIERFNVAKFLISLMHKLVAFICRTTAINQKRNNIVG